VILSTTDRLLHRRNDEVCVVPWLPDLAFATPVDDRKLSSIVLIDGKLTIQSQMMLGGPLGD
jgi:hypothetical protein